MNKMKMKRKLRSQGIKLRNNILRDIAIDVLNRGKRDALRTF